MADPAEKLARLAAEAGWDVRIHRAVAPKATFTIETSDVEEGSRSKRVAGESVEVPIVAVQCRRGPQTVWARWKDGKADGAVVTAPLTTLTITEATRLLRDSHTWDCRWLPAGGDVEVCQAHGEKRVRP